MSSDNRQVATDALATLGTIIGENEKRDAIHLAVIPAVSGERLRAGDHVEIDIDGKAILCEDGKGVGIVDPFLLERLRKGDRFWLVIYPRKITSLRHVWSHPAFPDDAPPVKEVAEVSDDELQRWPARVSERWIAGFADRIDQTVTTVMNGAKEWLEREEYVYCGENESYKEFWEQFPEFWRHYEIVTGTKVPEGKRESFFSCSC